MKFQILNQKKRKNRKSSFNDVYEIVLWNYLLQILFLISIFSFYYCYYFIFLFWRTSNTRTLNSNNNKIPISSMKKKRKEKKEPKDLHSQWTRFTSEITVQHVVSRKSRCFTTNLTAYVRLCRSVSSRRFVRCDSANN